jgi:ribosome-binding protein aMBF1 (putative translation factor)
MMKDIDEAVQRARDKRKLKNDELSKLLSTKKQY